MKPEIYKDEGYQFMGAAFEVYNDQGYGLAEEIYQECLEMELGLRRISFQSKVELNGSVSSSRSSLILPVNAAAPLRLISVY